MKLDIIIPVCDQYEYTQEILGHITKNTVKPNKIIIIDNSKSNETQDEINSVWKKELPILLLRQKSNIGVNRSWNLGIITASSEIISILNNDLTLTPWFFEMLLETFQNPQIGLVAPFTHPDRSVVLGISKKPNQNRFVELPNREGWAFSMRRVIALSAGPIPDTLTTFYGDDFFYYATKKQGYSCVKQRDNMIYHYLSRTLYSSGGHLFCGSDVEAWDKLLKEKRV